jgi:hypothetical protein
MDDLTTQVLKDLTQKLNNLEGYIATFHNIREQQLIGTINVLQARCERLEKQNDELRAEKLEILKGKI